MIKGALCLWALANQPPFDRTARFERAQLKQTSIASQTGAEIDELQSKGRCNNVIAGERKTVSGHVSFLTQR